MRIVKTLAALAASATLLTFAPVFAQTSGSSDFPAAKQQAELSSLGVRIAILLQKFDDPSSFEPKIRGRLQCIRPIRHIVFL